MRIINEPLLAEFRGLPCEYCHLRPGVPHHLASKGMGGGSRLDVRLNLCTLCLLCHKSLHDGNKPTPADILAIVARRERTTPEAIEHELFRLLRATKRPIARDAR